MERLKERLTIAAKAMATLSKVEDMNLPLEAARDVSILRFVYTFEAVWKAAQRYLLVSENIETGTPVAAIRGSRDSGLRSDAQTEAALLMNRDRNLTVHIYNEELGEEIFTRVPSHIEVLAAWLRAMRTRLEGAD